MFAPMTKWAVEVHDTARIAELARRAVRTAAEGRPGPAPLSLPLDVQQRVLSPAAPRSATPGASTGREPTRRGPRTPPGCWPRPRGRS